jgi:hypothetical protein
MVPQQPIRFDQYRPGSDQRRDHKVELFDALLVPRIITCEKCDEWTGVQQNSCDH